LSRAAQGRSSQAGVVLIHAILFICLLTTVISVVTGALLTRAHAVRMRAQRVQAYYAAEAGAAIAFASLDGDGAESVPPDLHGVVGSAEYEVTFAVNREKGVLVLHAQGRSGERSRKLTYELPATMLSSVKSLGLPVPEERRIDDDAPAPSHGSHPETPASETTEPPRDCRRLHEYASIPLRDESRDRGTSVECNERSGV
jgi:hypothetical protein